MNEKCLAVPDWWSADTVRSYYLAAIQSKGAPMSCLDGAEPLQKHQSTSGTELVGFRGREWQRVHMDLIWQRGSVSQTGTREFGLDHWHTSFQLEQYPVHIDYIRFGTAGPQTQYREYRVFVSAHQVARGGGFLGFLGGGFGCLRNWPLAAEFDEYLIYIDQFLQSWTGSVPGRLDTTSVLSVWKAVAARSP